jgi:hypothetical protein
LTACLTIVTESIEGQLAAEKLASLLCDNLGKGWMVQHAEPYHKFENSYKIEMACALEPGTQAILEGIRITDNIASPWMVYYDNDADTVELILNQGSQTQYRNRHFECILWAHWQVVEK